MSFFWQFNYLILIITLASIGCKVRLDCPDPSPNPSRTLVRTTSNYQPGPEAVDCLSLSSTTVNFGNSNKLEMSAWTYASVYGEVSAHLNFDLSWLPPGSTIISAKLNLYADTSSNMAVNKGHSTLSGSNSFIIRRITAPWNESSIFGTTIPQTDNVNALILPGSTSNFQNYENIDITTLLKDQYENPGTYHGISMRLLNNSAFRRMVFYSSDEMTYSQLRPKLDIEYEYEM